MEPYTVAGAQISMAELYSIIPFNVTFPGEEEEERRLQNLTEPQSASRSTAGIFIAVSITALYSVICVVGLLGNILVMYGVVRYPLTLVSSLWSLLSSL